MPRSPLLRTLLSLLPILGALLAVLGAKQNWPIALSVLAMAAVGAACATIYWSAPIVRSKASGPVEQDLPTAFVPHTLPEVAASASDGLSIPASEPGSSGTRADALATGEQYESDLLTGLLAPEAFFAWLSAGVRRCAEAKQTAVLVVCDLDAFGELNRTAGLVDANRLLRQIADCFRLTVREGDVLARLGGDEFALFFPGLTSEIAEARVRDLRAAVREAAFRIIAENPVQVTISVGMSCFPSDGETAEALMQTADAALAAAKLARTESADQPIPSGLVLTRN